MNLEGVYMSVSEKRSLTCVECPKCIPSDEMHYGVKFGICSVTGNVVFLEPWKEKKIKGRGWIYHEVTGCGLYRKEESAETTKSEKPEKVKYAIWNFRLDKKRWQSLDQPSSSCDMDDKI